MNYYWIIADYPFNQIVILNDSSIIIGNYPKEQIDKIIFDLQDGILPKNLHGQPIDSIQYIEKYTNNNMIKIKTDDREYNLNFTDESSSQFSKELLNKVKAKITVTHFNRKNKILYDFIKNVVIIIVFTMSILWIVNLIDPINSPSGLVFKSFKRLFNHIGQQGIYILGVVLTAIELMKLHKRIKYYSSVERIRINR